VNVDDPSVGTGADTTVRLGPDGKFGVVVTGTRP